ncbi:Cas9 inhibitor AcrIIA9 family protein [Segatella copri]|uniref:Cas9 inhibitor AcrIIA9 family protein n=1 Tax=Segatella copri TaxID=165179 RepID=UPI002078A397|nr:Cas9 inhibitor AcrIIA9 family protein [Segatella copri]
MKGTETFKKVIKAYLDKRAAEDELFAKDYAKPGKNIDDCCDFIYLRGQEIRKTGV